MIVQSDRLPLGRAEPNVKVPVVLMLLCLAADQFQHRNHLRRLIGVMDVKIFPFGVPEFHELQAGDGWRIDPYSFHAISNQPIGPLGCELVVFNGD